MRALLGGLIGVAVVVALVSGGGGGNNGPGVFQRSLEESEARDESEAAVKVVARREIRATAAEPRDWIIYSHCTNSSHCSAELRFVELPYAPIAIEQFRMNGDKASRQGPARFRLALSVDNEHGCAAAYRASRNSSDLEDCILSGVEETLE